MTDAFGAAFFRELSEGLDAASRNAALWDCTQAAAATIAERVIAGGALFLADGRGDFTSEGVHRAGGMMFLRAWSIGSEEVLGPRDTVIVGVCNAAIAGTEDEKAERKLLTRLQDSRAAAIRLGPGPSSQAGLAGDSAPRHELVLPLLTTSLFGGETYPLVSLINISWLWVLTSEAVAAFSSAGHMPAMYQSIQNRGSTARNARARDGADSRGLARTHSVSAVPPGRLGKQYLSALSASLRSLATTEAPAIEAAASHCADAVAAGRRVFPFLISHFPPHQWGAPGDPMLMQPPRPTSDGSVKPAEVEAAGLESGDVFLLIGYVRRAGVAATRVKELGGTIVECVTNDTAEPSDRTTVEEATGAPADLYINPHWHYGDAVVEVPGYDVRVMPTSGVLQTAIYWAIAGSMADSSRKPRL